MVGPRLSSGEEIIWASATDPTAKLAVFSELSQHAKERVKYYLFCIGGIALLWVLFPKLKFDPDQLIWLFIVMFFLELIGFVFKFVKTQQDKVGGYALTRSHLFELNTSGEIQRQLDASKVRYALRNESGIALAPLGQTLNSNRVMRWLPKSVTADQVQAAIAR